MLSRFLPLPDLNELCRPEPVAGIAGHEFSENPVNHLGIFSKYWSPGRVKTRLGATIGMEDASQLSKVFLATMLGRFSQMADHRWLVFTPAEHRQAFLGLNQPDWCLEPQSEGDLGSRMQHFFQRRFADGAGRVVLLGSDSPTLPVEYVSRAFRLLDDLPVVFCPTSDGGYCLVGATGEIPPIFDQISWGTSAVWKQTVQRLEQYKIPFGQLPHWYDIDQLNDLKKLQTELADVHDLPPNLDHLRDVVDRILNGGC